MAAPTQDGRQVMDRIAGFQRYLSITEEDRLETLHPPEKTPELFERFLPHAIATHLATHHRKLSVLPTRDNWLGLTYPDDRARVVSAMAALHHAGAYPTPLWPRA